MSDHLDDLLGGLGAGPVPALAPASAVRARGEQRRRRTRIASGLAGILLVGAVSGTALALSDGSGGKEGLQLASASPSTATSEPTASPTFSVPPAGAGVPAYRLLRERDAGAAAGGHWTFVGPKTNSPVAQLNCGVGVGTAGSSEQLRDLSGAVVTSQVVDFDASGSSKLTQLRDSAAGCGGRALTYTVESRPTSSSALIRMDGSPPPGVLYYLAVAGERSLAIVALPAAEKAHAAGWAAVALNRMGCVEQTCTVGADGCDELCQGGVTPAAGWPKQVGSGQGRYGVYLDVARDPRTDATLTALGILHQQAKSVGYISETGSLACDGGALESLQLSPEQSYTREAIFFATRADATSFVAKYQYGVLGVAEVHQLCTD